MTNSEMAEDGGLSFLQALKDASGSNNLADYKVVDGLVRNFIKESMDSIKSIPDENEWYESVVDNALNLADILLGDNPDYIAPKWNHPGWIDVRVGTEVDSDDPRERVAGPILDTLKQVMQLAFEISEQKLIAEQWQPAMSELVQTLTKKLMGIPT